MFLFLFSVFVWPSLPLAVEAARDTTTGTKLILLPDLIEPQSMYIDADRIYITEKHKIFIYSAHDFRLLKRFGRVGDEPDAFRRSGNRDLRLILDVHGHGLVVSSHERVSLFSKDGEFLKIVAEYPQVDYMTALGTGYVASAYVIEVGTGKSYQHAVLFDGNAEFVKKIAESHLGGGSAKGFGGPDRKLHVDLVPHFFGFKIFNDRIYVGNSFKGFFIEVFDSSGESLYTIERDYEKRKIPAAYKKERLDEIEGYKTYERYKESTVIDETEYLPAFRSFAVSGGRIYVYTHHRENGAQEVVALDLGGNRVKTTFVPRSECYRIYDDKYYYVTENGNEEWELRAVDIDSIANEEVKSDAAD
jgi:hypothetical protein